MASRRKARWEDMDKSKTELALLIQHFEVHNRTEGKSPRTCEWYMEVLGLFSAWLKDQGMSTSLGDIGEAHFVPLNLSEKQNP